MILIIIRNYIVNAIMNELNSCYQLKMKDDDFKSAPPPIFKYNSSVHRC